MIGFLIINLTFNRINTLRNKNFLRTNIKCNRNNYDKNKSGIS